MMPFCSSGIYHWWKRCDLFVRVISSGLWLFTGVILCGPGRVQSRWIALPRLVCIKSRKGIALMCLCRTWLDMDGNSCFELFHHFDRLSVGGNGFYKGRVEGQEYSDWPDFISNPRNNLNVWSAHQHTVCYSSSNDDWQEVCQEQ